MVRQIQRDHYVLSSLVTLPTASRDQGKENKLMVTLMEIRVYADCWRTHPDLHTLSTVLHPRRQKTLSAYKKIVCGQSQTSYANTYNVRKCGWALRSTCRTEWQYKSENRNAVINAYCRSNIQRAAFVHMKKQWKYVIIQQGQAGKITYWELRSSRLLHT